MIDRNELAALIDIPVDSVAHHHCRWIDALLKREQPLREEKWTDSVAVGRLHYGENVQEHPGVRGTSRQVSSSGG